MIFGNEVINNQNNMTEWQRNKLKYNDDQIDKYVNKEKENIEEKEKKEYRRIMSRRTALHNKIKKQVANKPKEICLCSERRWIKEEDITEKQIEAEIAFGFNFNK